MPTKSARLQPIHYPPSTDNQEQVKFPSSRYFQIHFEYLESELAETRRTMEIMQAQMADLYLRISLLTPELPEPKDHK